MSGKLATAISKRPFGGVFVSCSTLRIDLVSGFGLLLCSFLQSFSAPPWEAAHGEAFAFLAVLAWCSIVVRRSELQVRLNTPCIALLGMGLLVALQYGGGQIAFGGDAALLLIYIQLCIGTLLVAQWHADEAEWPSALAFTLLAAALVSALFALTQALGVWVDSGWISGHAGFRRPGANIGQPNHLGTLLVMGAASLIYVHQRWQISRVVAVLLSLCLLVGMGITESRTGLLSGLALSLWWFGRRQVFTFTVHWCWMLTGALALVAVMWVWPPLITQIQEGSSQLNGARINLGSGSRLELWRQLWEAAWMKPWLGWGLGGVSAAHNAVLHSYATSEQLTYAHNILLDMAIGMGFPLTMVALSVICIWGWRRVTSVRTMQAWYAVGILIPFAIHCLLEYPFAYAYFLVPVMLAIGLLERNWILPLGMVISRKFIMSGLIAFSAALGWVSVEYLAIEEDFSVARFAALNVGKTAADYERPHITVLTQLEAMLAAIRVVPGSDMSKEEIELSRLAAMRFPWAVIQRNYALILALNGNPDESIRQLKVIRAMHGEKTYAGIKAAWQELAKTRYPQLAKSSVF
jgi:Virulence factor membrane-bound polymerase, C-terminal/O-Antigen ligase/Protein glycosylation ligase